MRPGMQRGGAAIGRTDNYKGKTGHPPPGQQAGVIYTYRENNCRATHFVTSDENCLYLRAGRSGGSPHLPSQSLSWHLLNDEGCIDHQ